MQFTAGSLAECAADSRVEGDTMTTVTQTSRESYRKLNPRKLNSELAKCYAVFESEPDLAFSHRDISVLTKLAVNIAESRCSQLRRKGLLVFDALYYDFFTERYVQKWRLKHE
jgi:hypothetical protein